MFNDLGNCFSTFNYVGVWGGSTQNKARGWAGGSTGENQCIYLRYMHIYIYIYAWVQSQGQVR